MSVIGIHGIPGCGKTTASTYLAKKHYNNENKLFKRFFRYIRKKETLINNIYTNYPILLDKNKKIYSNIITIYDLDNRYSFLPNSLIVIDEVQAFFDSYRDFKKFPAAISTFIQFHRHFGIKDIYFISQHPRRIITYIRDVISQYNRIKLFIRIPIINLGIICYKLCYEFEDFTQAFTREKEVKKLLQIKTKFYIFNTRKVYKSFESKYLKVFNENKPLPTAGKYISFDLPDNVVENLYHKLFS